MKVHEEAQVPPLLSGIHELPAEEAAKVDIVAAAPPVPIGASRAAPPVITRAGLDGALRTGARHRMGNPSGGDGEDKCCFPTTCRGRKRRSTRGTRGAASTRSGRLRSLESHAPFPPLESRESGGRLCWEAWSLRESTAWARNHVHACNHALPRLRAFWFLGGSGAASERQTEKKGSEQLCTAKTSPKPKLGPCLRCKSCGAGGKTHYCREQLLRRL